MGLESSPRDIRGHGDGRENAQKTTTSNPLPEEAQKGAGRQRNQKPHCGIAHEPCYWAGGRCEVAFKPPISDVVRNNSNTQENKRSCGALTPSNAAPRPRGTRH